jgi:hypothetical protein
MDCEVVFYRGSMNNTVCDFNALGEGCTRLHVEERWMAEEGTLWEVCLDRVQGTAEMRTRKAQWQRDVAEGSR